MPPALRIPVALLVLALLATAFWWFSTDAPVPEPTLTTTAKPDDGAGNKPPSPETAPAPIREPERSAAEPAPLDEARARDRYPQGLRGIAVDEQGLPLPDVAVFLLESPANEPLAMPAMLRQGLTLGPTTSARTGPDGVFALGVQVATERLYEVHMLAAGRADARATGLRILAGQWHDLGAITLRRGATVRGRVTVEGSDLPAPQAVVTLIAGTAFDDTLLRALPGRENGLTAACDAGGYYEFPNAPAGGAIQLQAVAPGFAALLKQNIALAGDRPTEVDFGLRPGHSLGGALFGPDGRGIAGARVEAWPMHAAGQALLASSRADGGFLVHGLQAGAHRLRVFARGYQDLELVDVIPTRLDLRLELRARANLRVTVRDVDGLVLRSYQLALRRWFAPKDRPEETTAWRGDLGNVADVPDQRVRLDGMTDTAVLQGVPPGRYVVQVTAEGYAKSLSAPVEVGPETTALDLAVLATRGATLRGTVTDARGLPVGGATVATQAAGAMPDNPFWRLMAGAAPDKVTKATATTLADGSFELPRLALAEYDLTIEHRDFCRTLVRGVVLAEPEPLTIPPVRMEFGALVRGIVTVDGKNLGQVKVVLTSADPGTPGNGGAAVRLEAVTDARGEFTMPRRVPPGNYELRGLVLVAGEADSQSIHQLLQMQRSATPVSIRPGQGEAVCNLELPGR